MIHYALRCAAAHEFDGWFASSSAFDRQAAHGLVECPRCGSVRIERGMMAPRIGRMLADPAPAPRDAPKAAAPEPAVPSPSAAATVVPAGPTMPAEMRAALIRLRETVERNCDFVGPDFADQARRMHRGESEPRDIYGHGSETDIAQLREEGVPIASLPWVDRADS